MSAPQGYTAETDGDDSFGPATINVDLNVLADGRVTVDVTVVRAEGTNVVGWELSMDEARHVIAGLATVIR